MKRMQFSVMTGVGLVYSIVSYAQIATPQRPNVILLVADDLGYGDLSCYGATRVSTPHTDSIASSGVRFTDAHAVASTSTPSRFSLLTGDYSFRRAGTNIAAGDAGMLIRPEYYTIADMFKSCGYATGAFGKWHLGLGSTTGAQDWNTKLDMGLEDIGFDSSYIMAATADRVPCVLINNGVVANWDASAPISVSYTTNFAGEPTGAANPELLTKMKYSSGHNQSIVNGISRIGYMKGGGKALWVDENLADSILAHAVEFMEQNKDKPFFMYLATNDIHVPRMPHPRFRGKSVLGLRGESILQFDWEVGQVANALRRLGLDQNTLLIITSDNGPVLNDGYYDQSVALNGTHKPNGPFRGGKYSAFEAGTAVPFIVSWPGKVPVGKTSNALLSQIDDVASLAKLIGATIPEGASDDSEEHLNTWLGWNDESRNSVVEMAGNRTLSILMDGWKYIEPSTGAANTGTENIETGYLNADQLFHVSANKYESTNVFAANVAVGNRLKRKLAEIRMPHASKDTCFWYELYTPNRDSRYLTSRGAGKGTVGNIAHATNAAQWKFVLRNDSTYNIINRQDGSYLSPVAANTSQLFTSSRQPAKGWKLLTNGKMSCLFAITSGTSQVNQGIADRNWYVLNWGNGTNTTDAGCVYCVALADKDVSVVSGISRVELDKNRLVVKNGRFALTGYSGRIEMYDITGKRQKQGQLPNKGIYVVKTYNNAYKVVF